MYAPVVDVQTITFTSTDDCRSLKYTTAVHLQTILTQLTGACYCVTAVPTLDYDVFSYINTYKQS